MNLINRFCKNEIAGRIGRVQLENAAEDST